LHCQTGATAQGLAEIEEARPLVARDYPDDPWRMAWLDNSRAYCLMRAGNRSAAATLFRSSAPALLAKWNARSHFGAIARERMAAAGVRP